MLRFNAVVTYQQDFNCDFFQCLDYLTESCRWIAFSLIFRFQWFLFLSHTMGIWTKCRPKGTITQLYFRLIFLPSVKHILNSLQQLNITWRRHSLQISQLFKIYQGDWWEFSRYCITQYSLKCIDKRRQVEDHSLFKVLHARLRFLPVLGRVICYMHCLSLSK